MAHAASSWMRMDKTSDEWRKGFKDFVDSLFGGTYKGATTSCPCARCRNLSYQTRSSVESHLLARGFDESFVEAEERRGEGADDDTGDLGLGEQGDGGNAQDLIKSLISGTIKGDIISSGSEPNERAKKFFMLLKEGRMNCTLVARMLPRFLSLSGFFI